MANETKNVRASVKATAERTASNGNVYLTGELSDGTKFICWTPELLAGIGTGVPLDMTFDVNVRNGKPMLYLTSVDVPDEAVQPPAPTQPVEPEPEPEPESAPAPAAPASGTRIVGGTKRVVGRIKAAPEKSGTDETPDTPAETSGTNAPAAPRKNPAQPAPAPAAPTQPAKPDVAPAQPAEPEPSSLKAPVPEPETVIPKKLIGREAGKDYLKYIFSPLKAEEIECRVQRINESYAEILLYMTAPACIRKLNEEVGVFNWEVRHKLVGSVWVCELSIYDPDSNRWIVREDVGTESQIEPAKGQASDALKRAMSRFGVVELYSAPSIFLSSSDTIITKNKKGQFVLNDNISVSRVVYDEHRNITELELYSEKKHRVVFKWKKN